MLFFRFRRFTSYCYDRHHQLLPGSGPVPSGVAGGGVVSFSQAAGGGSYTAVKGRNETLKCSVRGISHHTVQYSAVQYSTVQYSHLPVQAANINIAPFILRNHCQHSPKHIQLEARGSLALNIIISRNFVSRFYNSNFSVSELLIFLCQASQLSPAPLNVPPNVAPVLDNETISAPVKLVFKLCSKTLVSVLIFAVV